MVLSNVSSLGNVELLRRLSLQNLIEVQVVYVAELNYGVVTTLSKVTVHVIVDLPTKFWLGFDLQVQLSIRVHGASQSR